MDRLSDGAIEINDNVVYERCGYSDYMNIADALNKLSDYEDAEEQGNFIKPKCKIGSECYFIKPNGKVTKCSLLSIEFDIRIKYHVCTSSYYGYDIYEIYKTKEEAEAAVFSIV